MAGWSRTLRAALTNPRALLAALGVGSAALYAALYLPFGARPGPAGYDQRIVAYPALFLSYFAACTLAWRHRAQLDGRRTALLVLGLAALFRIEVLSGPVEDNVDTWRYLWEGRVVLAGMNPYAAPPADRRYEGLRQVLRERGDPLFEHLRPDWNEVRSVYGPVATGLFTLPDLLPLDRSWSVRAMMAAFDLATVLVLLALLTALGRSPALALVYAWNPVCLDGFADRAHIDAAMVFFLALAVYLVVTGRCPWAGLACAAATLVKVSPLLLAPAFLRYGRGRFAVPFGAALALGALPYVLAGRGSVSGFRDFGMLWQDNDSVHALLLWALTPLRGTVEVAGVSRVLVMAAAAAYAVWRTFRGDARDPQWLFETCAAVTGVSLLLAPMLFPWYTAQLLVFLACAPNLGWLLLTGTTMSWYLALWAAIPGSPAAALFGAGARTTQPWRWATYPPVYALLAWEWWRRVRARPTTTALPGTPDSPPPLRAGRPSAASPE